MPGTLLLVGVWLLLIVWGAALIAGHNHRALLWVAMWKLAGQRKNTYAAHLLCLISTAGLASGGAYRTD